MASHFSIRPVIPQMTIALSPIAPGIRRHGFLLQTEGTDIQCPVVGIGETLDNQQLLAKYGTLEAALQAHGLEP